MKQNGKAYPVNSDVGILKWKMVLAEEEQLPISCEFSSRSAVGFNWNSGENRLKMIKLTKIDRLDLPKDNRSSLI